MTPERARYILDNRLLGGSFRRAFRQSCDGPWTRVYADGITPAEHAAVLELWRTMPGWTCYADAVRMIAVQADYTPAQ
jgi:hypothetical protein